MEHNFLFLIVESPVPVFFTDSEMFYQYMLACGNVKKNETECERSKVVPIYIFSHSPILKGNSRKFIFD